MMHSATVRLDLSHLPIQPRGPEELSVLWAAIEPQLYGDRPTLGHRWDISVQGGRAGLELLAGTPAGELVTPSTQFTVASVKERIRVVHACSTCAGEDRRVYAPFTCTHCDSGATSGKRVIGRACVDHVVILEGRLHSTCTAHRPRCQQPGCSQNATYWCAGRSCAVKLAYCAEHRKVPSNSVERAFCPSCFEAEYPDCAQPGCTNTGTMRCEIVTRNGPCRIPICARHGRRWQVLGPEKTGLAVCQGHATELPRLSVPQVLDAVIAGLALRSRTRLPSLGSFRHILINTSGVVLSFPVVLSQLRELDAGYQSTASRGKRDALKAAQGGWERELAQDGGRQQRGRELFEMALRDWSTVSPSAAVASLTFSDLREPREKPPILFVRAPQEFRGPLIGRGGAAMKHVQASLAPHAPGIRIMFEEKS